MVVRAYAVCIGVTLECRQTELEMIRDGQGCADKADEAYHDIGPISVVLGLDPKDNFRSSSGHGGGMPLFGQLDLHGGIDVGMVSDGELSSGAGKSFP